MKRISKNEKILMEILNKYYYKFSYPILKWKFIEKSKQQSKNIKNELELTFSKLIKRLAKENKISITITDISELNNNQYIELLTDKTKSSVTRKTRKALLKLIELQELGHREFFNDNKLLIEAEYIIFTLNNYRSYPKVSDFKREVFSILNKLIELNEYFPLKRQCMKAASPNSYN